MTVAAPAKAQPTAKATAAEKGAAERLGSAFLYLAALRALPLDQTAIPLNERVGQLRAPLLSALGKIYGTDSERERALGTSNYLSRYVLYKTDYDAVMPKVGRTALAWTQAALKREEIELGTLRLKLENQSGLPEQLQAAAERISKSAGGFDATRQELKDAAPPKEPKVPGIPAQDHYAFDPKYIQKISKLARSRVAKAVRKENNETLSILFAHPRGIQILRAYSENPNDGTTLAAGLIQKAQDATVAFRIELSDPDQDSHFWRYPALVSSGLKEVGLFDIPGFAEYAVSVGQVLSRSTVESAINFAGMALVCLSIFFTGPVALLVIGAGDLALSGAGAGLSYIREREQELGAQASALRDESNQFSASPEYLDTALAGAAALLSAIAFFKTAQELTHLVAARPKAIREVIAPKVEPISPAREISDPRLVEGAVGKDPAKLAEERGTANSLKAAEPDQKAAQRGLTHDASTPGSANVKPAELAAKSDDVVVGSRLTATDGSADHLGLHLNEFSPEELSTETEGIGSGETLTAKGGPRDNTGVHLNEFDPEALRVETSKPGFGEASKEKGGTEHHVGMFYHEYSAAEVAIGLRVDWDPVAARPRKVTYNFTAEAAEVPSQATDRSFHQEKRLKGQSAQSAEKDYLKSGMDKGHLAQREAGKVDPAVDAALGLSKPTGPEVERALDVLTNVAPMKPTLNQGAAWRAAETRTAQFAKQEGYVAVEVIPLYDLTPQRLKNGTPIPSKFRRIIKSGPSGKVLEDLTFVNK